MFQNFIDILAAPTAAFERLKTAPSFWFPLVLVMVCIASIQVGYLLLTDFNFLLDQMVDQALASNPNARESEVRAANGQVRQAALQPLSLDSMLALNSGKNIWQSLNLPAFWSFALLTLGYRHFTGKSLSKSATITLAPYALVYGIWALASLL